MPLPKLPIAGWDKENIRISAVHPYNWAIVLIPGIVFVGAMLMVGAIWQVLASSGAPVG